MKQDKNVGISEIIISEEGKKLEDMARSLAIEAGQTIRRKDWNTQLRLEHTAVAQELSPLCIARFKGVYKLMNKGFFNGPDLEIRYFDDVFPWPSYFKFIEATTRTEKLTLRDLTEMMSRLTGKPSNVHAIGRHSVLYGEDAKGNYTADEALRHYFINHT